MESMVLLRAVCDYRIDWFAPHVQPFLLFILAMERAQLGNFARLKKKPAKRTDHDGDVPHLGEHNDVFETLLEECLSSTQVTVQSI
jgi:hypothetical protein